MRFLLPLAALLLGACATTAPPAPATTSWRAVATEPDRDRLADWRRAFLEGLAKARAAGHASDIAAEGALLDPDAAIGGPIPAGDYRCRVIKLGAKSEGLLDYIAYPGFACRVSAGRLLKFEKLTGSQRHVGAIYPADRLRSVFLGSLALGDEQRAMPYGSDPDRDVAGWVERIGPARWRIILPFPRFESVTDIVELVPAG